MKSLKFFTKSGQILNNIYMIVLSHFRRSISWSFWVLFYGALPVVIALIAKNVFHIDIDAIISERSADIESKLYSHTLPEDFICTCASFLTGGILVDISDVEDRNTKHSDFKNQTRITNAVYYLSIFFIFLSKCSKQIEYNYYYSISIWILSLSFLLSVFVKYSIYKITN